MSISISRNLHCLLLAGLGLALVPVAAEACHPPVVVIGADRTPSYLSPDRNLTGELEALFGTAPDGLATLIVDVPNRTGYWLSRQGGLPLTDAMVLLGADTAFRYGGPDNCAPQDVELVLLPGGKPFNPIELFPDPDPFPDRPIELFPGEAGHGPQPLSGLWQARLGETRLEGCPPMIQHAFPQSPAALPSELTAPRRLEFKVPFHPDQLEITRSLSAGGSSPVVWRNAGTDSWQTEVFPQLFDQIPAGQGAGSKLNWNLTVKSRAQIDHVSTLQIVLPKEAAAVMGNTAHCRMISRNAWVRVGD
ncbi:hypothetical protein ACVNHC_05600 [Pannonibacter sp. Q-1]